MFSTREGVVFDAEDNLAHYSHTHDLNNDAYLAQDARARDGLVPDSRVPRIV